MDAAKLATLAGNTNPLARAANDRGAAPAALRMNRMLLLLRRDPAQERQLAQLLDQQQEKSSSNFHKWLTPAEFGEQFGPADQDIQAVISWLTSQGFQVSGVSNGRTVIEFSGTAGQVQQAFHTAIHAYQVNGQKHWANATDPEVPAALAPVVAGFDSLNDFARRPMSHFAGTFHKDNTTGVVTPLDPQFTYPTGCSTTSNPFCLFPVGPYDFATIYNVLPLWNAATPIDGTGQTIAVVGETDINPQDFTDFRTLFGLGASTGTLNIIQNGPDPGTNGEEPEADIDTQWAGAIAKGAAIDYVVSASTEATAGVDLSAQYAVDNNLAPILSESYGQCELFLGSGGNQFYKALWQQAAAEGITVVLASGDQGSAACDDGVDYAQNGLAVSGIASTPYDIAVGGTDFNDLTNPTTYWNLTNDANHASAKGYIPEMTWNNSCTNAEIQTFFQLSTAEDTCNNEQAQTDGFLTVTGAGGGTSSCTTPGTGGTPASCAGGYPQPAWQTSFNNSNSPSDGKRHVPDISLFASNGFNGSFYMICQRDAGSTNGCGVNYLGYTFQGYGGTSVTAPAFASVMALIDQETGSRQGNANYVLYSWAAESGTSCNANAPSGSSCIFYDLSNGTIAMPCLKGSPSCQVNNASHSYGVLSGYSSGTGYDLASGLGSVNVANLVNGWKNVAGQFQPSVTTLTLNHGAAVSIAHGSSVPVDISVSAASPGSPSPPVPTGDVSLVAAGGNNPASAGTFTLSNGSASGTTNTLSGGTSYSVTAHYAGDANYAASDSTPVTVTVTPESSQTSLRIIATDSSGNITNQNASSFSYGSPYFLRADATNSSGANCFNTSTNTANYACPSGTISLTDNGNALGTAPVPLNIQGYTEDLAIQLSGGTHTLIGNYSGDNSYTPSSNRDVLTVAPAATTTSISRPTSSTTPQTVIIGQPFPVFISMTTQSSGAAPGGTYSILDGGATIGSGPAVGYAASNTSEAFANATVSGTPGGPSGPHTISVVYSGDTNYASSASGSVLVTARYSSTVEITATPNTVIYGSPVTLSVTVSTTNPASNPALKPTGTMSFYTDSTQTEVPLSPGQDSSGHWILQASLVITPNRTDTVSATYSGDDNYESSAGYVPISVTIPGFNVSAGTTPLIVTAGQPATDTLTITPLTSYTSTVALSCPPYISIPGSTCSISPASVTLANGAAATATLTFSLAAPSSSLSAAVPRRSRASLILMSSGGWWTLGAAAGLASLLLLLLPGRRRRLRATTGFALVCGLALAIGCGGGGGSNGSAGGGGSGSGPAPQASTTTTLSTSAAKIPLGGMVVLTVTVRSSNPVTGIASVTDGFSPPLVAQSAPLANGSAQITAAAMPNIRPGTHGITATYTGDSDNKPSVSGVLNVTVTGNTTLFILGQTGQQQHEFQMIATIQ
ncbi:MAG TPA: Ig-like domain repeat protein [Candidatus Acidoferrales bacterium]|nr:Ig-like domain repeat protein [Candidatus Acidoferrales bacterium]